MRKSYVYKITCKITGEFYFGSSFNAKRDWYWGGGKRIRERIAQYGKDNFIKEILGEFDDRVEAHKVENEYIEKFRNDEKCLNERIEYHFKLYGEESRTKNSTAKRGKHLSEETRAKLSASLKGLMSGENHPMYGKHPSEETRAKLSASLKGLMSGENHPMYGKHHTEETRSKISAGNRGKHLSDETRAKLSAVNIGKFSGKHWRKNPVTGKREWYE